MGYDYSKIEKKWQKFWEDNKTFVNDMYDFSKKKYYVLDMFPYPSGNGLHVGHVEGYTASDIIARMKRMQGYNVFHPMGWDAFGLPAEQYAIKTNKHPLGFTIENINNFRRQIKALGLSYNWEHEISTTDPKYYKWTQWGFLNMYNNGLAYIDYKPVNFCPALGTVLANEEVVDGKSEVGGFSVERKLMRQWVLKITAYAETLLKDLEGLDWPTSTLEMQKNWIGKSLGVEITFKVFDKDYEFKIFTTRADTLFGCTYCCLAPEHPLINKITSKECQKSVEDYIKGVSMKSDMDRTELNKDKTGVFVGAYAINPINNKKVPIFVADYVLMNYGDGAVMAVPAHDQRDYEFAKKYDLEMIKVLDGDISEEAFEKDGVHINSAFANGLNIEDAKKVIIDRLEQLGVGKLVTHYKLRDWLFSRQRYWGEPIPMIIMEDNSLRALKENELPLLLPDLKAYKPSGSGESPLALASSWVNVEIDGKKGKRETNTMPQWAGSCWYYIRYLDPNNDKQIADPKLIKHWLPVDLYIGGAEHAVLHLLYARFWHKVLYDLHYVDCKEPFKKLYHQGMILGANGEKMSKSRGNVVNPDDVIKTYGADALRLYEMFMGPLEASLPWSEKGLDGAKRFLDRVFRLFYEDEYKNKYTMENDHQLDFSYNLMIKKVTNDFNNLQFNTAISQMMIFVNDLYKQEKLYIPYLEGLVKVLSPICPHICEEMWEMLSFKGGISFVSWPEYDENKLIKEEIEIAVQVNGKLRGTIKVPNEASEKEIEEASLKNENVLRHTQDKTIKKIIIIKNKIVNIVVI